MKRLHFFSLALLLLAQHVGASDVVKLRIELVSSPHDQIKNVFLNIDSIEMLAASQGVDNSFAFGQEIGIIDLLSLVSGNTFSVATFLLDEETEIGQITLALKGYKNSMTLLDNSNCLFQISGPKQPKLKMLSQSIILKSGYDYRMLIDFDPKKSVAIEEHGVCTLTPVFRIRSLIKTPLGSVALQPNLKAKQYSPTPISDYFPEDAEAFNNL